MALNPVERRLAHLCGEWITFRENRAARLLLWQVENDCLRLLQAFFESQKHDTPYRSGDLFIVFDAPFEHSIQYSRVLKQSLVGQYEASRDELATQGEATDWMPGPASAPHSPEGFVSALCSLGSRYHHSVGTVVAVLLPQLVMDEAAFVSWVERALDRGLPERMRLILADTLGTPQHQELATRDDPRIVVAQPQVNALNMAQETFAQEATTGPAGVFRNHLTGLAALLEKGSADQVKAKALDALAFARAQQWSDQEVVLRLMVAGALLKEARCSEAIQVYEAARLAAEKTVAAEHPAGRKLVLQTWFGQAGAHLADGDEAQAVVCYDQATAVAQQDRNPILAIEAQRMAGYCRWRQSDVDGALVGYGRALAMGAQLRAEVRGMTTLPLAAVDMLRAVDPERTASVEAVKLRLDRQLEQDRREAGEQAAAAGATISEASALQIESQLDESLARSRQAAEDELQQLVADGSGTFAACFANSRRLLGSDWPLVGTAAFPGLSGGPGLAAADGSAA